MEEGKRLVILFRHVERSDMVDAIQKAGGNAKLTAYPGVGHVIPLEIPQQSADDVRAFIQRN